jgi:hypothetical protein
MPATPAARQPTKKAPAKKRGRRGLVLLVLAVIVVIIIVATSSSKSTPPSHAAKVSAFNGLVASIKSGLATCNAGASDTQIELGLVLQAGSSAPASDLVQLDSASKSAQSGCDDTQNNALLNMENGSVPGSLSSLSSLSGINTEAGIWATDSGKVLHDIQNLAESSGSGVADAAQLKTDVQTADGDQASLNSALQSAGTTLGVKFNGLGLTNWSS